MADVMFPFLALIPNLKKKMLKLNWNSLELIPEITIPILFVTGDKDTFVPMHMTQRLFDAATGSRHKELFVVPGGNHNDTFMVAGPAYGERLTKFIQLCHKE